MFYKIGGRGLETNALLKIFDLRDAVTAAKKAETDAKRVAKLTAYATAATKIFQSNKAVEKYTQAELLAVLAYFMNGQKHTTVGKGMNAADGRAAKVQRVKALISAALNAQRAAQAQQPTPVGVYSS